MSDLVSYLFQTHAFKICPDEQPFWYTSGKIGPYFINAQFLYGSEKDANEFLEFINQELENATGKSIKDSILTEAFTRIGISTELNKESIEQFAVISQEQGFIDELPAEDLICR